MNIIEAAQEIENGRYVKRSIWPFGVFVFAAEQDNFIRFRHGDGSASDAWLESRDLLATDWEIVE